MTNQEILKNIDTLNIHKKKLKIYIQNHFPEIYKAIFENTSFLDKNNRKITFAERIYCIKNNIKSNILCEICHKNPVAFLTDSGHYRKHCGVRCSNLDKEVQNKKNKTYIRKTGYSWMKNPKQSEKMIETKINKYGKDNISNQKKAKKTRFEKYGKYTSPDFLKKIKKTKKERYGNENWVNQEKAIQTLQQKSGLKITCAFQLPEIIEKTKIGNRKKSWNYILKSNFVIPMFTLEDYLLIPNLNKDDCLTFKCKKCGTIFKSKWDNGCCKLCPTCYPELHGTSKLELEIFEFVQSQNFKKYIKIFNSTDINRKILLPKEIDIICTKNDIPFLGIEFDGLYWHSELTGTNSLYHLNKTELCEKQGIQLIHIFENEWLTKQDIVKSRLKNLLGFYDKKIFARKCYIKEISNSISKKFQEKTHIQDAVNAKINLGLFHEEKLISVMTFGKSRFNKQYEWELLRFCTELGYHIPGGASKLLKYFERNYKPKSLISYADRRWSQGKLYKALGFQLDHISKPNYWYILPYNTSKIFNRIKFQKFKLKKLLKNYDQSLSEIENMKNNGYFRIFDCGNLVFTKYYFNTSSETDAD